MSSFTLYSCGIAICDTYVLAVKCLQHLSKCRLFDRIKGLHLLSDVANYTVCECAPFCTVLFVFCLTTKRPSDCGLSGRQRQHWNWNKHANVALVVVFFFPSWENCIGWLCFRCRYMLVVLLLLVATVLQQMRHTGSSRLSGSSLSFGLKPKCSHTAAVAFGFETKSIFVFIPSNLN